MALTVIFRDRDGNETATRAHIGQSLMEAAVNAAISGIDAECGGAAACGTCMVTIAQEWRDEAGPASFLEEAMLEMTDKLKPGARLSCQIRLTAALDGLVAIVPESQR